MRHGGREGHQLREGQAARRAARRGVLRDERQGEHQRQGEVIAVNVNHGLFAPA